MQFLPFLLIIVVFWFLIIRPQQKRQRDAQQMQSTLGVDSKVMLSSGIFGTVTEMTDDYIAVEIADGVSIRVIRGAISRILPEDFGEETEAEIGTDVDGDAAVVTGPETDPAAPIEVDEGADSSAATGQSGEESVEDTLAKYTPKPVQQPEKND